MDNQLVTKAIDTLKEANIRITPQRHAVVEYLVTYHNHPTADDIYHALEERFPNMSVATVYNNLRLLTDLGLVNEMKYGDASSHFDFSTERHYHVICQKCGKIVDFHYPSLEDVEMAASRLTNFAINEHRLELYGDCPDCQQKG
ncbi:Fur family peroxide stress response transcriptional regulator [Enterococcus sp. PF1-24]|uniref:Fur family transcriptional regulator n=1 Tax=unclassified Enterococcus TaxID=2608891 RepID=UPI002475E5B7|nr:MULTISPECIES: Fur family transcriptional regulator [unclassified Enterococcus]MDH6363138.1 Fur family peroxide stress response transcriptional regulator [Enterococcus sp. PFB1-1]MDH6400232.1 Fur family peroxide stress response transcriptional regulator [Enterococcus sp. PF1-24]